jgi:sulfopyruvate decarboxylase subunit beta
MEASEALRLLLPYRGDALVVTTMTPAKLWGSLSSHPLDLPLIGAMGKASSLALGLALARPERPVWVFDGDGSLLNNLGSLVTVAASAPRNFYHFLFENGVYETSGGQPIPGAGTVDFVGLAKSAGYRQSFGFASIGDLRAGIEAILKEPGPAFVCLRVAPGGSHLPFPSRQTKQAIHEIQAFFQMRA